MVNRHTELKVSEDFRRLVQPISGEKLSCLEKEILRKSSAKVFVFNGIIVDGYEEYEIAVKLGIPIETITIPADNRNEAVIWICRTQLKRSDLTLMMRKYLIGRRSLAEQAIQNNDLHEIPGKTRSDNIITPIRMKIANEYNYCYRAVGAYEACAKTIDMLFSIERELAIQLLCEKRHILQKDLISFAKLSEKQLKYRMKNLFDKKNLSETMPTIKSTPKYDPDAELSSLSLTVPSWINMIERVRKNVTPQITERAADEIFEKLNALKEAAENLVEHIMEVL